jgi:hypothetical protein
MLRYLTAALVLLSMLSSDPAVADVRSVEGEIELPSDVPVVSYPGNETHVTVQGTFRVTAKNGPDQILRLTGTIAVEGGQWPGAVEPSTFDDVQAGTDYEFTISFIVPAGTEDGANTAYTVTLLLMNILGPNQIVASFRVEVENKGGNGGSEDGIDLGSVDMSDFPWGLFIFIGGLIVFLLLGLIWAYRNLELVREVGGRRRVMMREKHSGRIIKRRYPPSR